MPDLPEDGQHAQNEEDGWKYSHCLAQQWGGDLDRLLQVPGQREVGGQLDTSQTPWITPEGESCMSRSNRTCL